METCPAKGNRKKVTDPDGVATTYGYDALDRLETATLPDGVATYRYWPDGLEKGRSVPGVEEGRCYDAAGRLTAIVTANGAIAADCTASAPQVSAFGYAYDANGNRSRQTEQRREVATQLSGATETTTYGYDALDRLTGVLYPGGRAVLYRLDPVGNRTGERELTGVAPDGVVLASYGAAPAGATVARDVTRTFNRSDWLIAVHQPRQLRGDAGGHAELAPLRGTRVAVLSGSPILAATARSTREGP